MILVSACGRVLVRARGGCPRAGGSDARRSLGIALPFLANTPGWIFTEAGRQPWIVYGLMKTDVGGVSAVAADVAGTLIGFILLYTRARRRSTPR